MKIEIVTHCYAEAIPAFAQTLVYQLSSLALFPPLCEVDIRVCYTGSDHRVVRVLNHFAGLQLPFQLFSYAMPLEELGRRSIGRNIAAKNTEADIVWFTDVDHLFRGCLDRLIVIEWPNDATMIYPQEVQFSNDHETGDRTAERIGDSLDIVDIDPLEFKTKRYRIAIGGIQIVRGDFCREHGYLDASPKWQQPTDKPFGDFKDDIRYRKFCEDYNGVEPIDLPGVFRIRSSQQSYR